jgi:hypothetical protein
VVLSGWHAGRRRVRRETAGSRGRFTGVDVALLV